MNLYTLATTALLATAIATPAAFASSHGNDLVHARKFNGVVYMMNEVHMSLYTFDKDAANVSNCYDGCAAEWPPALLPAGSELGDNYTLLKRKDGSMQIAYRGKPLYLFAGDSAVGDVNGDGLGGVWHLSTP